MGNENLKDDVLLISVEEACKITKIGRNTMLRLVKTRGFPALWTKRKIWIDKRGLADWITKNYGELKL